MAIMSKDIVSKILCCLLPIMAFVASGYEHCVANMYLIPAGLFVQGAPYGGFAQIWTNIVPVTLGNIVRDGQYFTVGAEPVRRALNHVIGGLPGARKQNLNRRIRFTQRRSRRCA